MKEWKLTIHGLVHNHIGHLKIKIKNKPIIKKTLVRENNSYQRVILEYFIDGICNNEDSRSYFITS